MEATPAGLGPLGMPASAPDGAAARSASPARQPRAPGSRPFTPSSLHDSLDIRGRLRLGLQRRSEVNLRRHVGRAALRFSVLIAGDVAAALAMRGFLRAVRDHAVLGETLARGVAALMPRGALTGWQYGAALVISFLVLGNYGPGDRRRDAGRLFLGCALAVALALWMSLWTRQVPLVLLQFVLTTLLVWSGILAERFAIDRVVAFVRPSNWESARTLFVGPAEKCRRAAQAPVFASGRDYQVLGFVDSEETTTADALGSLADLSRIIQETHAEAVVIAGYFREAAFRTLVDTALAAGCELISVPRTLSIAGLRPTLVWRGGEPLVTLTAPALRAQQLAVKRIVDVAGVLLGLLLLSPILVLVGALVKLDSRGPALFRQQRVGLGGRLFGVLKFRTMVADADAKKESLAHLSHSGDGRLFKIPDDPRVTRLGRWLRRWSVDELPQLWNVLVGEMSLVGPRPFFPQDLKHYAEHHFDRLGAKPGITGLWQVSGRSAVADFEEVVRFDREYIESWSLILDLKILLRTIPAVFTKRGAY